MRVLLLIGILIATFGLFTLAGCAGVNSAVEVLDKYPRTTLHAFTIFDAGSTRFIISEGGREANPILAHVIDEHGLATMITGQFILNEIVLRWEERACAGGSDFFYWRSCSLARTIRLGFTAGHIAGGGWNVGQIVIEKQTNETGR